MPLYEYQCSKCAEPFTLLQNMTVRPGETVCPHCGTDKIQRLFSTFASKVDGRTGLSKGIPPSVCATGGCGCG